jgi:hypothetical protein
MFKIRLILVFCGNNNLLGNFFDREATKRILRGCVLLKQLDVICVNFLYYTRLLPLLVFLLDYIHSLFLCFRVTWNDNSLSLFHVNFSFIGNHFCNIFSLHRGWRNHFERGALHVPQSR